MRIKLLLPTLLLLVASVGVAPALAAKPPGQAPGAAKTPALTLSADPTVVTYGQSTTLSGRLSNTAKDAIQPVQIQALAFPFTGEWQNALKPTTQANGSYSASFIARLNTQLRAQDVRMPALQSAPVTVRVRYAVILRVSDSTPRSGTRVTFSGIVRPAAVGAVVRIQRRGSDGIYRTAAKTLVRADSTYRSRYSRRVAVRRNGVFRVRVVTPNGQRLLSGTSRTRTLTVH